MTTSEFNTLLERIDRVDGKVDSLTNVVTAHVAAEEAVPKRRAHVIAVIAALASWAAVGVAVLALVRR